MGIIALIGPANTMTFFGKKSKIMGSAFYFTGVIMIILGWRFFVLGGFILQMWGIFLLFRSFLKTIFAYMQTLPVIGPLLRDTPMIHKIVNSISNSANKNSGSSADYSAKKFEV